MHENEDWIVWNPQNINAEIVSGAYDVEIANEEDNLRFTVYCENSIVDVCFHCVVPMYLYSDEGMRMAAYMPVQEKNNDRAYLGKWFLYKIENSDFMKWAVKESCGFYSEEDLLHFCIVTENDIVDILSLGEPTVVVRETNSNK